MNFGYVENKQAYRYIFIGLLFIYFGFSHDQSKVFPAYLKFGSGIIALIIGLYTFFKKQFNEENE